MLNLLLAVILILIIAGVGYWAVTKIGAALGLPAPVIVVAQVLIAVVALVYLIQRVWPAAGLG